MLFRPTDSGADEPVHLERIGNYQIRKYILKT